MFKQKNYLALGAVVLVAVVLLSLPSRATARLKLAVGSWFLPLFGLAGAAQQLPADLADSVLPRRELLQQVDNLRRENQQLRSQAVQSAAIARENDQLRALFNWQRQSPWRLKLANVVMRDPANWWRTVQIDLGSRDGLRENLPVITDAGLVGRVSSVSLTRAQVVLHRRPELPRFRPRGKCRARHGRARSPAAPLDTSLVELTYLASSANLKPGQSVITSGLGGDFSERHSHRPNRGLALRRIRPLHRRAGETQRQPRLARTSLGFVSMNAFHNHPDFGLRVSRRVWRSDACPRRAIWLGAQIDLLPALMVYAALNAGLPTVALLAVFGGLWFDTLSANPLGISILPLCSSAGRFICAAI